MIQRENGETFHASTKLEAKRVARRLLGGVIYYGAQYRSDREVDLITERREPCTDLDCWRMLAEARQQSGACAPVVISWA
jgi:hypothetical protein